MSFLIVTKQLISVRTISPYCGGIIFFRYSRASGIPLDSGEEAGDAEASLTPDWELKRLTKEASDTHLTDNQLMCN